MINGFLVPVISQSSLLDTSLAYLCLCSCHDNRIRIYTDPSVCVCVCAYSELEKIS